MFLTEFIINCRAQAARSIPRVTSLFLISFLVVAVDPVAARAGGSATAILLVPDDNGDFVGTNIDGDLHKISIQTACDTDDTTGDLTTESSKIYLSDMTLAISVIQMVPKKNALGSYVNQVPADLDWVNNSLALNFRYEASNIQQYTLQGNRFSGDSDNGFIVRLVYMDLLGSKFLQILFPLQDNTQPVVQIDLTGPGFQRYARKCYEQKIQMEQDRGNSDTIDQSNAPPQVPPTPASQDSQSQLTAPFQSGGAVSTSPPPPTIACLLPNGSTVQAQSLGDCRNQNGLITNQ